MANQNIVQTTITQLYGTAIPTKRRALFVTQAQAATIRFQFLDNNGNQIDLDDYTDEGSQAPASITCKIREVITTRRQDVYTIDCTIDNADEGIVTFDIPSGVARNPGVYTAEFAVFNSAELTLMFSNKCFIWIDRGLFGDPKYPNAGPPTYDEVRLYIRDNGPEENLLLDDFEFDLAEICHAAETAVRYWNESQPPIRVYFNTCNYAVRDKWLAYIAGHMFIMAAHRFRRNHIAYQAGGITVDDQNKFQDYMVTGTELVKDYREWVKQKKVQINCMAAITSLGSPYGSSAYYALNY